MSGFDLFSFSYDQLHWIRVDKTQTVSAVCETELGIRVVCTCGVHWKFCHCANGVLIVGIVLIMADKSMCILCNIPCLASLARLTRFRAASILSCSVYLRRAPQANYLFSLWNVVVLSLVCAVSYGPHFISPSKSSLWHHDERFGLANVGSIHENNVMSCFLTGACPSSSTFIRFAVSLLRCVVSARWCSQYMPSSRISSVDSCRFYGS